MPFRYGIAVMRELPHVFVVVEAEINGVVQQGVAADHLPPKWFTKDPDRNPVDEIDDMIAVIDHAAQASQGLAAESVFALWQKLYCLQNDWGRGEGHPPLLYHFGTSLIERSLIDAFCRAQGKPFHELLYKNAFGIRLNAIHPELENSTPSDWLPRQPLDSVTCRHTVGLSDPLEDADIALQERLSDGLPQSLAACIRRYGLSQFKIKVTSATDESIPRLERIVDLLQRETNGHFSASLDGNESFQSIAQFRDFWAMLRTRHRIVPLLDNLLFVEQPFHRDSALGQDFASELRDWNERPPLIIDESDAKSESVREALDAGYIGVSHKNCKGVFRGIANACLLAKRRQSNPDSRLQMSGEDLANIGPVALLQDLAVQAALGNSSVERNGHHYFKGLSFWPTGIQSLMLQAHADLYQPTQGGWPSLVIRKGDISLGSINRAPFGTQFLPTAGDLPDAAQ